MRWISRSMLLLVGVSAQAFPAPEVGVVQQADWAALSKQAEVAKLAGHLSDAAALYARAARANPTQAIPAEGACEVALALEAEGKAGRTSSRDACRRAYTLLGTPENARNEVASLMAPGRRPSLDDLVDAALVADSEVHVSPDRPWGFLARCDIAHRMGSADVMEACLADLRRVAPDHAATKQALASLREPASFGRWVVRALLLLTLVGTLAHALLHRRRSLRDPRPLFGARVAAILVVAFSVLSGPGIRAAHAEVSKAAGGTNPHLSDLKKDQLSQGPIDDANPEVSVPSPEERDKAPLQFGYLLQDLAGKAEQAIKRGDHAAAARYYKALSKATPDSSYGPRKLCEQLEAAGDIATAIMACRTAVTLGGATANDFVRFVDLVLTERGPLPPLQRKELEAVVAHVSKEPNLGAIPAILRCQVALRFEDQIALGACTTDLKKIAPDDPKTISFRWALALQKKDKSAALQLITRARDAGMSSDGLAMMEKATRQMARRQIGRFILLGAGGALVALLVAMGIRHLSGRRGSDNGRPLPVA